MIAHRKQTGSTIFLVALVIGTIFFISLCGIGFNCLLFSRAQAQYKADAMTLSLATSLNTADRIGTFNQLQADSRELIFISRQNCDQSSDARLPELTALCGQLVDEARSGHVLLENERQNLLLLIQKEVQRAVAAYNQERNTNGNFIFFGLHAYEPEILRVDLGRITKINCNVAAHESVPELAAFDSYKGYFDKKSKLYQCEVNAKLPSPDSDLDFHLSSLPANVSKTCAPSRNTNANVFVPYGTIFDADKIKNTALKEIPSAIQITYALNVMFPGNQSSVAPVHLIATGTASGALSDSQ